jgi:hypothetical protein
MQNSAWFVNPPLSGSGIAHAADPAKLTETDQEIP